MIERKFAYPAICRNISSYMIGRVTSNSGCEEKSDRILLVNSSIEDGFSAYIINDSVYESNREFLSNKRYAICNEGFDKLLDNDVVGLNDNKIRILYRSDSEDNVLLVTNQCNSNCIMCPDSDAIRNVDSNVNTEYLLDTIKAIPKNAKHVTITGGEPFMLKRELLSVLDCCRKELPNTDFLLLTNARALADNTFFCELLDCLPHSIRFGIPLYASNESLHDYITSFKGSFNQTICGISNLLKNNIEVEIRIVVLKQNYKQLEELAFYISKFLNGVNMVNIMALEMSGNAYINRENVWVNYIDYKDILYKSCMILIKSDVPVYLYNFPLCNIDERLINIACKSISDYKVRYKEECDRCMLKDACGGFFATTINMPDIIVKPFRSENV